MKVGIVNIGDEILIGQILNTNAHWMSQKLTNEGFEVCKNLIVADDAKEIKEAIDIMMADVDVILLTGGLGPTKDDITQTTLCEYFGTTRVFSEEVLKNIENLWKSRPTPVNELTKTQAYVPKDCLVIQNVVGTAPITCFESKEKTLVSLPGVPYEMKYNMENEIIPLLQKKYQKEKYIFQNILIKDYTESTLAMYLEDFENNLPKQIHLAYLPSPRLVKLRLFTRGEQNQSTFDSQYDKLCNLLKGYIIARVDLPLETLLSEKLKQMKLTVGTAESCTGGNMSQMITRLPGASEIFKGSIVSYSNSVKINILNVSSELIEKGGVVQEQVVEAMALGAQKALDVDCAIATSGIAGPTGGSEQKPVGTVWICTRVGDKSISVCYQFGNYREANIMSASNAGIIQLLGMLED